MSNSVLHSAVGSIQTLPKPFYSFLTLVDSVVRDLFDGLISYLHVEDADLEPSPIDMQFARHIVGQFSETISTPLGMRKIHLRGPLVAHLNNEYHGTDLPFANRANVFVTGFSSRCELLVSELDRDGQTIYNRLINPHTRRVVAKTVRGNCRQWESWD